MKILQINTVYPNGSTGKIALGIHNMCKQHNYECITGYRYKENKNEVEDTFTVSSYLDCHIHNRLAGYTGLQGCFSQFRTLMFLKKVKKYSPDIIHLHNIHGSYINIGMLFKFIKKHNIKVIWTLHDCWSFTGFCPHFTLNKCEKWKSGCENCPESYNIPFNKLFDTVKFMYFRKKKYFTDIDNMILVTPSEWLKNLVEKSFLKNFPCVVINNGIDTDIFQPKSNDFREKYNISLNKKIVLGVSFGWGYKKGLDVFKDIAKLLDDKKYQIVLVGTDEKVDKKLPENIISIHRTANQEELASFYSAADVFVNPTREDTFPTVNLEALACGTPVITFNTGGSPECINEKSGVVVEYNNIEDLVKQINRICTEIPYAAEDCCAVGSSFNKNNKFKEYLALYEYCTYNTKRSI